MKPVRLAAFALASGALLLAIAGCGGSSSPGQRIYEQGVGTQGPIERTAGGVASTSGPGCASCHGFDAKGSGNAPPCDMGTLCSKRAIKHVSDVGGARLVFVHNPAEGSSSSHDSGGDKNKPKNDSKKSSGSKDESKDGSSDSKSSDATSSGDMGSGSDQMTEGPWTDEQIVEVLRTGKTPEGLELSQAMPRWNISQEDARELLTYLGEL